LGGKIRGKIGFLGGEKETRRVGKEILVKMPRYSFSLNKSYFGIEVFELKKNN
jgi:hypothetical protein